MVRTTSSVGWCGVVTLLVLSGCGPEQFSSTKTKPDGTQPSTASQGAEANTAFHALTLDAALKKAQAEDKVVMVDFYADWCGPCRLLDQKTWPDEQVQEWLKARTIAVKLNVDKEEALSEKYKISSIPALVFLKPDGTEVGRLEGFIKPQDFRKRADALLAEK